MASTNLSKEETALFVFCLHADIFTDGKAVIETSICPIKVVYLLNMQIRTLQMSSVKS